MLLDLQYGDLLSTLMLMYENDGLGAVVENYNIETIGNMILEEKNSETILFLGKLILYYEGADAFRTNLEELDAQWKGEDSLFSRREKEDQPHHESSFTRGVG